MTDIDKIYDEFLKQRDEVTSEDFYCIENKIFWQKGNIFCPHAGVALFKW